VRSPRLVGSLRSRGAGGRPRCPARCDFGRNQRKVCRHVLAGGPDETETRPLRRDLVRRVIALDPVIDEALGEDSDLRRHSPVLQAAVGGLFAALSGWRTAALHLELLPSDQGRREADIIFENIPQELRSVPAQGVRTSWMVDPSGVRRACAARVRTLTGLPAHTPSLRLLADRTAEALIGIRRALDGLLLLVDPARNIPLRRSAGFSVPDLLPALVNAVRVFVTIGAAELFWIATAWPNGAQAITYATIAVILFSPRGDQAYATTMSFMVGTGLITNMRLMGFPKPGRNGVRLRNSANAGGKSCVATRCRASPSQRLMVPNLRRKCGRPSLGWPRTRAADHPESC
jgi:hypothetical protein